MKLFTKTTIAFTVLVCLTQVLDAQTVGKGAWMVGGTAAFSSQKYKDADESLTRFNISPDVGYFFADDLAVGLDVDYSNIDFGSTSTSLFSVGPFIRYYLIDPVFLELDANFGLGDLEFTEYGAAVGYSFFLNNSVSLEPKLYYRIHNVDDTSVVDFDSNTFGLAISFQAFLNHDHGME